MIEQTKTKIIYTVGTSTVFPFNVKFFDRKDVKVKLNNELLTLNKDYEIELKENYANGANIILIKKALPNDRLTIYRSLSLTQSLDLPEYGKLSTEALENALDRIVMSLQELADNSVFYDGEDEIDFNSLIADLIKVQDFVSNADELSVSAAKAAVSAAQALISAINAAQYAEAAKSVSGIPEHNVNKEAHEDIRTLISELQKDFNTHEDHYDEHIQDYAGHITKNNDEHNDFSKNITSHDKRLSALENNKREIHGNSYWAFGYNNVCQLGMNWTSIINNPIDLLGMRDITKVSISTSGGVAIAGGRLYVTGNGANGLCGPDRQNVYGFRPHAAVDNIYSWSDAACFRETAWAISNGYLYSWGDSSLNCLGDNATNDRAIPRIISDLSFKQVAAGCRVMLALTDNGDVYSCGASGEGALGHGILSETNGKLTYISYLDNINYISAGGAVYKDKYRGFCAAIRAVSDNEAQLYVWGYNGFGQLGMGNTNNLAAPTLCSIDFVPKKVICGAFHMVVLAEDGAVYIAGHKDAVRATENKTTFVKIPTENQIIDITGGYNVTYLLTNVGTLLGLGVAANGSLLDRTTTTATPVELILDQNITQIFCGSENYSCAYTVAEEVADETV